MTQRRRADVVIWLAWIAAGAAGGAFATLVNFARLDAGLNDADQVSGLVYDMIFAATAAIFQYLLLRFVAAGRRAAAWWVPASVLANVVYLRLEVLWFSAGPNFASWLSATFPSLSSESTFNVILDGSVIDYALAYGAFQGLVLMLLTGRRASVAIWVGGNLLGLLTSRYAPSLVPQGPGPALMASTAIFTGAYAAGTGLALVVILRMRRAAPAPQVLETAADLQGQG